MSIATEITALSNNLTAAKNAVTAKGGTVGDTGLAGLATEIGTIPSGGGPSGNWGTLKYLDTNNVEQTINIVNEDDFLELGFVLHNSSSATIRINGTLISVTQVTEIEVADGIQYIPSWFGAYFTNLKKVTLPSSVHYISDYFCMNADITSPVNTENVVSLGMN